jgi:hypothetical protein
MNFAYQCSLAGTLYTVEANKEWRWLSTLGSKRLSVFGDPVEDERHTVFRLVINDFRHLVGRKVQAVCVCMRVLNNLPVYI